MLMTHCHELTLFSDVIEDIEKMEDREKNDASYVMKIIFGPGIHGPPAVIIGFIAAKIFIT